MSHRAGAPQSGDASKANGFGRRLSLVALDTLIEEAAS
jgi:hypothetical protein